MKKLLTILHEKGDGIIEKDDGELSKLLLTPIDDTMLETNEYGKFNDLLLTPVDDGLQIIDYIMLLRSDIAYLEENGNDRENEDVYISASSEGINTAKLPKTTIILNNGDRKIIDLPVGTQCNTLKFKIHKRTVEANVTSIPITAYYFDDNKLEYSDFLFKNNNNVFTQIIIASHFGINTSGGRRKRKSRANRRKRKSRAN